MIKIPPYLQPGDIIGVLCPAGYMAIERVTSCIVTLEQWGFLVEIGATVGAQHNYFSGTDEERLQDVQSMLDNPRIKAILCARGGYGISRIIDKIDFSRFVKHPKWIIGFSDVTVLHSHIFTQYGIATMHAPMAAAFNDGGSENEYVQSVLSCITGQPANYTCTAHRFNKTGVAKATLVGGNLSLLAHLVGTASDINTAGKILFIEDIGEYIYNVDRMLVQLKRSGKLDKLAGLIVGGFTDMNDTTIPFGRDVLTVICEQVAPYSYPVCFDFPVSHGNQNFALKVGCTYTLDVALQDVRLTEAALS